MKQTEPVSIILPTYNRANQIGKAIESVLAQTYEDFELIVVDDGSTDETEKVVTSYKDCRIRYHRMPENGGQSRARNWHAMIIWHLRTAMICGVREN